MAIGAQRNANPTEAASVAYLASAKGDWVTANDDLETAQDAGDLLSPRSVDQSTVHWVKVGANATRVLVRATCTDDSGTVTTQPVVRVIGAFGPDDPVSDPEDSGFGQFAASNTLTFMRLDNADTDAAGFELTIEEDSAAMDNGGSTNLYSGDPKPDLNGIDLKGARYVTVLVQTAASIAEDGPAYAELLFIN